MAFKKDSLFDHPHHPLVAGGARLGLLVLPEELSRVLPLLLYGAAAERHEDLPRHRAAWQPCRREIPKAMVVRMGKSMNIIEL